MQSSKLCAVQLILEWPNLYLKVESNHTGHFKIRYKFKIVQRKHSVIRM